jgi:Bifunctional DNA primase/polymerase, N-terminal
LNDNDEVEVEVGPGKVAYALAYARHGLRVFPAHWLRPDGTCSCRNPKKCGNSPGKHPIEEKWQESATTDESKIRWWWSRNPEANIGVLCDTITVVDVDPRHGGDDTLHKLEAEHGELPPTPTVITHSGGTHLYFKHVPGLQNAVAFAPGLDIRTLSPKGKVGLVIGVGSVNTGGRYEWDASATIGDVPLAEMPLWLIEIIKAGQGKRGKRSRGAEFSRVTGRRSLTALAIMRSPRRLGG